MVYQAALEAYTERELPIMKEEVRSILQSDRYISNGLVISILD